jgi:hypothetical protein
MSGTFLDTTIIVELAKDAAATSVGASAAAHIASNPPAECAYYALRELAAGPLQYLCEAHNKMVAAVDAAEALASLVAMHSATGRRKAAGINAFAMSLARSFATSPDASRNLLKREMAIDLSIEVHRLWNKARSTAGVRLAQPLACFDPARLEIGPGGEIRGPNGSFGCDRSERCAAAGYVFDESAALSKVIAALQPSALGPVAAAKNENRQRRKALEELKKDGPKRFNKRYCRAIGDAYFAVMCAPGMDVLTTNTVDLSPLCSAVGKRAVSP